MSESEEERGYKVTDKRKKAEPTPLSDNAGVHVGESQESGIDFGSFAISLGHTAYAAMGLVAHPETDQVSVDLPTAKHMIELLEMLQKKTKNNLDEEEDRLLGGLLYELRMSYLDVNK